MIETIWTRCGGGFLEFSSNPYGIQESKHILGDRQPADDDTRWSSDDPVLRVGGAVTLRSCSCTRQGTTDDYQLSGSFEADGRRGFDAKRPGSAEVPNCDEGARIACHVLIRGFCSVGGRCRA